MVSRAAPPNTQVRFRHLQERSSVTEPFAAAQAYEGYIGRWSRVVAAEFLRWLGAPERATWCDVGCGTGALTSAVLAFCNPARVDASDPNAERIAFARQAIADARATFTVGEAARISAPDRTYDAIVGGLAFPAIRDTAAALAELIRVGKPGGIVAGYVWDFDGEMQVLRYFWNAAAELEPQAEADSADERFALCHPDQLSAAWRAAGLHDVAVRAIDARARFAGFDDFWTPFLSGDSPAQTYVGSLDERRRAELCAALRRALPIASDGSITLVTRAWAVSGGIAGA
ncbi:MAG: class I SAM-dependent methyltransferase [Candidatus Velthaea sp.]|jgi:SAM-dependent methyltransferase